MTPELERGIAFEEALREAAAERVEQVPLGTAIFNGSLPLVWSLNTLRVEKASVSAEEIAAEAERLQSAAGLEHRRAIVLDESTGHAVEGAFEALGWKPEAFLFMVPKREPNHPVDTTGVVEVEREALRPIREAILNEWLDDLSKEALHQLQEMDRLIASAGKARHFAALVDGEPVSSADLYSDGRTAQIEDVGTLPEHRGAGYASAVVMRALEEARAMGHDFVFLVADARDWPKELYRRLGFDGIGETYAFLKSEHAA